MAKCPILGSRFLTSDRAGWPKEVRIPSTSEMVIPKKYQVQELGKRDLGGPLLRTLFPGFDDHPCPKRAPNSSLLKHKKAGDVNIGLKRELWDPRKKLKLVGPYKAGENAYQLVVVSPKKTVALDFARETKGNQPNVRGIKRNALQTPCGPQKTWETNLLLEVLRGFQVRGSLEEGQTYCVGLC